MKNLIIPFIILISSSIQAQIEFEDIELEKKEVIETYVYDSTTNEVPIKHIKSLIGQSLFALGEGGLFKSRRFKLTKKMFSDNSGENIYYYPISGNYSNSRASQYDSIVGHYFEIKNTINYNSKCYLELLDKERNNIVYYEYSESEISRWTELNISIKLLT